MKRYFVILMAILAAAMCSCGKESGGGEEGGGGSDASNTYFSVSANTKVQFAPGNLAYDRDGGYSFVSTLLMGNTFCWGTGDRPLYKSDDVDFNEFKTFVDWGDYVTIDGGGWRTLTRAEWGYLRDYRKNADKLLAGATVCERWGCLLLPDNWKTPKGMTIKLYNGDTTSFEDNKFTQEDWDKLAAAGAVFLPYFETKEKDRWGDDSYEINGEYHSSSNYEYAGMVINYSACTVRVGEHAGLLQWNLQRLRCNRAAVRLVRDVK